MNIVDKFQNNLKCICNNDVIFNVIDNIECDWGEHTVIQCSNCEELFSIDKKCIAFQSLEQLFKLNIGLFTEKEKFDYLLNPHPC